MKTFLIGAGASAGSIHRLPVMRGFLDPSIVSDKNSYGYLRAFLVKEFERPGLIQSVSHDQLLLEVLPELNVEEVFGHLELLIQNTASHLPLHGELLVARSQLFRYIHNRLRVDEATDVCQVYESLLKNVDGADAIVSFNWDVLLDRALLASDASRQGLYINQRIIFRAGDDVLRENLGFYLKLHGSLHWFYCENRRCPAYGLIKRRNLLDESRMSASLWSEGIEEQSGRSICINCGQDLSPGIIPPIAGKRHRMIAGITAQWTKALHCLQRSEEWVFVGYSVSPIDIEALSLIRSADKSYYASLFATWGRGRRTIHVADPNAGEIQSRLEGLLSGMYLSWKLYESFQDFVNRYPQD